MWKTVEILFKSKYSYYIWRYIYWAIKIFLVYPTASALNSVAAKYFSTSCINLLKMSFSIDVGW